MNELIRGKPRLIFSRNELLTDHVCTVGAPVRNPRASSSGQVLLSLMLYRTLAPVEAAITVALIVNVRVVPFVIVVAITVLMRTHEEHIVDPSGYVPVT